MSKDKDVLKTLLHLSTLPREGGKFKELRPRDPCNGRSVDGTQIIYFLLEGLENSIWHKTRDVEEIIVFNRGNTALILHEIDFDGNYKKILIGDKMSHPQATYLHVRRPSYWMAAELLDKSDDSYCLVSCITTPSFEWECFESLPETDFKMKFPHLNGYFGHEFFERSEGNSQ